MPLFFFLFFFFALVLLTYYINKFSYSFKELLYEKRHIWVTFKGLLKKVLSQHYFIDAFVSTY